MSPWDVIEKLYQSEINAGLAAEWDSGVTAYIGDSYNGVLTRASFRPSEFHQIAAWLDVEARRLFPHSKYVTGAPSAVEGRTRSVGLSGGHGRSVLQ